MHRSLLSIVAALALTALACGSETASDDSSAEPSSGQEASRPTDSGIRMISPADGAALLDDPPPDLVVLDVRTAEEFDEGHLADATMLDFYAADFADRVAELDPDVPYLIYCRSGNRSGQTRALMEDLGFTDVADVDGGILAWTDAGLAVTP